MRNAQNTRGKLLERTAKIALKTSLLEENLYVREKISLSNGHHRMVGRSPAFWRMIHQAEQVAPSASTVLLLGETGTGKKLLAQTIHELSSRRDRVLVSVNCAIKPVALLESELFGREIGVFTGSPSRQIGQFELADNSTIFLDEVGDLPPEVQAKILRVLEAQQIERLGNPKPVPVNVRIIAATNRDLEKEVAAGKFRQDLYCRLNVFPIAVPPLRERGEDIPLLVWTFVDEFAKTFNKNFESVERASMEALQHYRWPGNIWELRNLIERAILVAASPKLRIPLPRSSAVLLSPSYRKMNEAERENVQGLLEESGLHIYGANGAAEKFGLSPTILKARMAKLGIRPPGGISEN